MKQFITITCAIIVVVLSCYFGYEQVSYNKAKALGSYMVQCDKDAHYARKLTSAMFSSESFEKVFHEEIIATDQHFISIEEFCRIRDGLSKFNKIRIEKYMNTIQNWRQSLGYEEVKAESNSGYEQKIAESLFTGTPK